MFQWWTASPFPVFLLFWLQSVDAKEKQQEQVHAQCLRVSWRGSSGADFASGWKDHFLHHGYNKDDLEALVLKDVDRPMLMKAELDESISRDIALR